ncbi:hypothetical protein H5201_21050 [Pseudoalteromonas sp. SG43-6]|uniref:hypothetical protein n=1 Tax=Pseudoalteromonas sp. SG43-6 TaxID=2760967 RepID=UPI001600ED4F|nr:hypothetical protein [Pseudoalteromonas sp. SG43-6]MBB1436743.1 hypothetical protein [Pseudoalteromonas sp. SG43-6]
MKTIVCLFVIYFSMIGYAAASFERGVHLSHTFNNVHLDPDSAGHQYISSWRPSESIVCRSEDSMSDCGQDLFRNSNALLVISNYDSRSPAWSASSKSHVMNIPIINQETGTFYNVKLLCDISNGVRNRGCYAGVASHSNGGRIISLYLDRASFSDVPDGIYSSSSVGISATDWHSSYLIFTASFNINIMVNRSSSEQPVNVTTLHPIQGNTLPIIFNKVSVNEEYGIGSLDFCLETDDYSSLDMFIVTDAPYISLYGQRRDLAKFQLTNIEGSTEQSKRVIEYTVESQTLGLIGAGSCSSNNTRFCQAIIKNIDFEGLATSDSPGGGGCKRFDLRIKTDVFNTQEKLSGEYTSSFYINIDKGT